MLALSRFLIIKYPQFRMKWAPPWLLPLIWAALLVVFMGGLLAAEFVAITFNKDKGVCVMYGSVAGFDFSNITNETLLTKEMMQRDINKKIAWSSVLALPIPFIVLCFFLSLRYLKMVRV
jgi:hypothetical protein